MEAIRDALATDRAVQRDALGSFAACSKASSDGCLEEISKAIGGGHFLAEKPDNPSLSAMSIVLERDGHVGRVPSPESWLAVMKGGRGPASDTLRLAILRALAREAKVYDHPLTSELEARALMRVVGASVPGACATYVALGDGVDVKTMKAEESPDHSPCVHKDLSRREGPGPRYGEGIYRAAEAAATLLRETERAIRMGIELTEEPGRSFARDKLGIVEKATLALRLPKLESAADPSVAAYLSGVHSDAGIPYLAAPIDGGAPPHPRQGMP